MGPTKSLTAFPSRVFQVAGLSMVALGCDVKIQLEAACRSQEFVKTWKVNGYMVRSLEMGAGCLENGIPGRGYVVSRSFHNPGDRKSPISRVVGPLPNGLSMAYKWLIQLAQNGL